MLERKKMHWHDTLIIEKKKKKPNHTISFSTEQEDDQEVQQGRKRIYKKRTNLVKIT